MASFLYRLGRSSYRRRGRVVALWAALLVLIGVSAATLSGNTSDTFSIPGTESQRAIDLLEERMPEAGADAASARVVFWTDGDRAVTDPEVAATISEVVAEIGQLPQVAMAMDPFATGSVAPDGQTALASVTYLVPSMELDDTDRDALQAAATRAEAAGVSVDIGGSAMQATPAPGVTSEIIGLLVAAVVLVITFGALVAAGLPVLTALIGVAVGVLGIQIATGFFELSSTTTTLAVMLGLAVGIDYALFIVSRFRHELLVHRDGEEAAGRAVGTAGSAVVFAGLTVAIALTALTVVGIPFLTAMGLAAAGTVLVAVVIALTLLPALLGFAGTRVLGRKGFQAEDIEGDTGPTPMGERWSTFVVRFRIPVLVAAIVGLGVLALPATDLRLGLPTEATAAADSTQRQAYDRLAQAFGPGFNGPLLVTVDLSGATDPDGATATIQDGLTGLPGVAVATPPTPNQAGDLAIIPVIPLSGPSEAETEDLVHAIRDRAETWQDENRAAVAVTGETAVAIDVSEKLADALLPYLAVVVGLAFILLTLVFRSLLVPLKATAGFLLSVAATFGAVVAVFQWGWLADVFRIESTGPIVSFLPIIMIGLLFGLAMDYEVFLVTRMREEFVHGAACDDAINHGFRHGARVVSAAAVIMIAVFGGFIFAPDAIIKSIGFALALGVLLDAFVVRMTIVPAVMSLLGSRAWWLPRWLDRALPDVDVEGTKLAALTATPPANPASGERVPAGAGGRR